MRSPHQSREAKALLLISGLLALASCGRAVEPILPVAATPARIEVRQVDGHYDWFLKDGVEPATDESIEKALNTYAAVVDERAGFEGTDYTGQSANPIVFAAPPGASAEWFVRLAERAVQARMYRVQARLVVEGRDPFVQWIELPKDESLVPRYEDSLTLTIRREGSQFSFTAVPTTSGRAADTRVGIADSDLTGNGWSDPMYRSASDKVANALVAAENKIHGGARDVLLVCDWRPDGPSWGVVFVALNAIRIASQSGRRLATQGFVTVPMAIAEPEPSDD